MIDDEIETASCTDCGRTVAVHRYRCRDCYYTLTIVGVYESD